MAKVTTRSLYDQVIGEIDKRLGTSIARYYNQTGGGGYLPLSFGDRSAGTSAASVAEIVNAIQLMLEETLGSHIISGLSVEATSPETSNVIVRSGSGSVGAMLYTLEEDTTINIPLSLGPKIFYVMLYKNGVKVDTVIDSKKVLLAKIIVPTETTPLRIYDKRDDNSHAYITSFKEITLYGHSLQLEEESVDTLRNAMTELLADNLIGNIRLSENLKILNTQGTLEIDSKSIQLFDVDENLLAKLDKDGTHYYNLLGVEIAKFGVTEAFLGEILITENTIQSRDFVSGALGQGFQLQANGEAEFNNVFVRGKLSSSVFEYDTISVIGGNLLLLEGDVLDADMSVLDSSTLTIKGDVTFANGDILRLKDNTSDEWVSVVSNANAPLYTITRDLAGSYSADENPAWAAGTAVTNYGQSGAGGIFMTASESNAPYLSIFSHAGSPWSAITTHLRLGNLNGFLGYAADTYGIGIGTTDSYLKYDVSNGLQIKGSITVTGGTATITYTQDIEPGSSGDSNTPKEGDIWFDTSTGTVYVYTAASGGYAWEASVADSGLTDANGKLLLPTSPDGAGLYIGSDYLGYYNSSWKAYIANDGTFYFGGDASNYVQWNGAALTVRGTLIADDITSGTLSGIVISGNTIQTAGSNSRVVMTSSAFTAYDNSSAIGEEVFKIILTGDDAGDIIIGDINNDNYVKYDDSSGTLTIRGTLVADDISSGTFTGLTIQTAGSGARVVMDSTTGLVAYDNTPSEVFKILVSGADVGDVIFGSATNYMKWDKSAATLLVAGLQSPDYVSNTSGYKLSGSTGLEVNEGSISGLAAKSGNFENCVLDWLGRTKEMGGVTCFRDGDIDTGSYYFMYCSDTDGIWERSGLMQEVFDYYSGSGGNRYLGVWFVKRPGVTKLSWRFRAKAQVGIPTSTRYIRTSIYGQSLYSSIEEWTDGQDKTATFEIDISSLTDSVSYFVAITQKCSYSRYFDLLESEIFMGV